MPELPDVEGFREILARHAMGRRIHRIDVCDTGVLHGVTGRAFADALTGRRFGPPRRHGKWLIAGTDGPTVLMHFGMTGALLWRPAGAPRHRHDRVVFVLDGAELRFRDMRKLQGLWLAHDPWAVQRVLERLGPDAMAARPGEFDELLSGRRAAVKAVLVDQSGLAGLGNLLVDEILWRAGIHPRRGAGELSRRQRRHLYEQMREVLRVSVRTGRVPSRRSWLTGVRGDPDGRCPRCGAPLSRGRVAGRGTAWCPRCQPSPA